MPDPVEGASSADSFNLRAAAEEVFRSNPSVESHADSDSDGIISEIDDSATPDVTDDVSETEAPSETSADDSGEAVADTENIAELADVPKQYWDVVLKALAASGDARYKGLEKAWTKKTQALSSEKTKYESISKTLGEHGLTPEHLPLLIKKVQEFREFEELLAKPDAKLIVGDKILVDNSRASIDPSEMTREELLAERERLLRQAEAKAAKVKEDSQTASVRTLANEKASAWAAANSNLGNTVQMMALEFLKDDIQSGRLTANEELFTRHFETVMNDRVLKARHYLAQVDSKVNAAETTLPNSSSRPPSRQVSSIRDAYKTAKEELGTDFSKAYREDFTL